MRTELIDDGPQSWIVLSVIDSGPGIPEDVLHRIFEPVFTIKPIGQGTGLGLRLVHEIIQKHSRWISVDSHPGRTEFRVQFPAPTSHRSAA